MELAKFYEARRAKTKQLLMNDYREFLMQTGDEQAAAMLTLALTVEMGVEIYDMTDTVVEG